MTKVLLSLFYVVHGLIHLSFIQKPPVQQEGAPAWPFYIDHSWIGLGSNVLKPLATILVLVATFGFIFLGLGTMGWLIPAAWIKIIAVVASIASLVLMILFWNNWYVVGFLLSLLIMFWYLGFRLK